MTDNTFQSSFTAVTLLALVLFILAIAGVVPSWIIAIAIIGGLAGDGTLLYFWGKDYMSRL